MNWTDSPEDNIRLALHRYGALTRTQMTKLFHHRVTVVARDKALERMIESGEITRIETGRGPKPSSRSYCLTPKEEDELPDS